MTENVENPNPSPEDPIQTAPEEQPADFDRRLAAGTGGGDWHLSEEDRAADQQAKAAEDGTIDPDEDFQRRLAAGTGGGDWHMTEEDRRVAEEAAESGVAPYLDQPAGPGPTADPNVLPTPEPGMPEPQAISQPGPTPGAENPAADPAAPADPAPADPAAPPA